MNHLSLSEFKDQGIQMIEKGQIVELFSLLGSVISMDSDLYLNLHLIKQRYIKQMDYVLLGFISRPGPEFPQLLQELLQSISEEDLNTDIFNGQRKHAYLA